MAERIMPGPASCGKDSCEAVCIHTRKIYDSCRDKDCIEDLRFYPDACGQDILNRAQSVSGGRAELLYTHIHVEPVRFNRGFFTVDLRFFYRVVINAYCASSRPVEVEGLCFFDKRVILFGSEGSARIFSSQFQSEGMDRVTLEQSNMPTAVLEAVDPIVLGVKLEEQDRRRCGCGCDVCEVPECVCRCFGSELTMGDGDRVVLVTLGQFSMVRLERDSQLLMPVYNYCIPEKECSGSGGNRGGDDPCQLFRGIGFPMEEFFPPNTLDPGREGDGGKKCGCCR